MAFAKIKNRKTRKAEADTELSYSARVIWDKHHRYPNLSYVHSYVDRIVKRSLNRNWGFTREHFDDLSAQLARRDHAGERALVGVRIWLGRDLAYNWQEMQLWMEREAKYMGFSVDTQRFRPTRFFPGSEIGGEPSLTAIGLELPRWTSSQKSFPCQIRASRPSWPSLEIPALLCLNPGLMGVLNPREPLMALGLVNSSDPVYFFSHNRHVYTFPQGAYDQMGKPVIARYRDL